MYTALWQGQIILLVKILIVTETLPHLIISVKSHQDSLSSKEVLAKNPV